VNGEKSDFKQSPLVVVPPVGDPVIPTPTPTPTPSPQPSPPTDDITGIGTIKAILDPIEKTTANISWTTIGDIDYFLVRYGQNP
jgi:hypothetical protein